MTISEQTPRSGPYNGDDATVAFAYGFLVDDEDELVVVLLSAAGVETVQTITTHYTVSGVGNNSGGTVTMVTAPATGEKLSIRRATTIDQGIDFQNRGAVVPQTIEDGLDEVTKVTQDLQEQVGRAVLIGVTDNVSDISIPSPSANDLIGWNSAGDDWTNYTPNTSSYVGLPGTSTDNGILRWNGTTGLEIQDTSGPVMADDGRITTVTDPTGAQDAATKTYVDTAGTAIRKDGTTADVSADIPFNSNKLTGVADPTANQDAATKLYVDSHLLDEDGFTSNSATKPPSQQSVGAYLGNAEHIQAATADASPVATTDYVMTYDADADTGKKVLLDKIGGWQWISTATAADSATIDITLPSGYTHYKVVIDDVLPATDNTSLYLRTSTDGGSTFDAGAADYAYVARTWDANGTSVAYDNNSSSAIVVFAGAGNVAAQEEGSVELTIYNPSETGARTNFTWQALSMMTTAVMRAVIGSAQRRASEDADAVQFSFASGNIATGNFMLYGIK